MESAGRGLTTWEMGADGFAVKLLLLLNSAVMLWVPTVKLPDDTVAIPFALTAPELNEFPSALKVMLPLGVPPEGVNNAVKVTLCPKSEGLTDEETVKVAGALLIAIVPLPLLAEYESSPAKLAPKKSVPAFAPLRFTFVAVATPLASVTAVAFMFPLLKLIVFPLTPPLRVESVAVSVAGPP